MEQISCSSESASDDSSEDHEGLERASLKAVSLDEQDREPPQDSTVDEVRKWESDSEESNHNGPTVARHKQRNKKSDIDTENSVTRHEVFNSRQEARSNRVLVRSKRKKESIFRRDLNFRNCERSPSQVEPTRPMGRVGAKLRRLTMQPAIFDSDSDPNVRNRQYTIPPPKEKDTCFIVGIRAFFFLKFRDFIFWLFKTSFLNVMVVALMFYLSFCNFFTLIIYGVIGKSGGKGIECLDGWDYVGVDGGSSLNWELSFSLSWTSFSTVGFGTVSPSVLAGCYGLRYTCAIEAFLGVLYAGFCGAVFFAKFSRLMGRAQVIFSSTMCIHYGDGLSEHTEARSFKAKSILEKNPFPILEFRVVNERANDKGCELLDATIACLVCVHQSSDVGDSTLKERLDSEKMSRRSSNELLFDDTPDEKVGQRQKYHNLNLQTRHHPYFRRVWYLRHQLDANSPLLEREVRNKIKRCRHWPSALNNHVAIRASLIQFNDIIVTLNATSNLNASDVFAQYRYKLRDLHVGWVFAGMLYKQEEKLKVDTSLIHDIRPQFVGGHEPIGVITRD